MSTEHTDQSNESPTEQPDWLEGFLDFAEVIVAERTKELVEVEMPDLIREGFMAPGHRYGLEQLLDKPESWDEASKEAKNLFLKTVGQTLGVNLIDYVEEDVVRTYQEEGHEEARTREGASVKVLRTKFDWLEVHILEYVSDEVGTRYDLVIIEPPSSEQDE